MPRPARYRLIQLLAAAVLTMFGAAWSGWLAGRHRTEGASMFCAHCRREIDDGNQTWLVIAGAKDHAGFAAGPRTYYTLFDGIVCFDCVSPIYAAIRAWCAAPQPDQPTPVDIPPAPKSTYVLEPRRPWWLRVPLAVLLNVLQGLAYGSVSFAVWYYLTTHPKH